jgi:hypothetical protein
MNDELERIWKAAVDNIFERLSWYYLERLRKTAKNSVKITCVQTDIRANIS